MFVEELSQKFTTEEYRPLIAISKIIISDNKPEISDVFFYLGCYRYEIDEINALEIEIDHWYRHKALKKIKTMEEPRIHFAKDNLKSFFPNIFILLSIFLTVPLSSAEGERSFSCLKRIKSDLRTTMGQTRLS